MCLVLNPELYRNYIDAFNENDEEVSFRFIDNDSSWSWLKTNIPFFECPNKVIEETYYFRWWVYRKHIKQTLDGFILTEFLHDVPWAGKYNSISAACGHHFYEGRWLRNAQMYMNDYAVFWYKKGGNLRVYSEWLADAIWNYCLVRGEYGFAIDLLPDIITNYYGWQKNNFTGAGLYWSCDDRDAMEISISGPGLRPTLNSYQYAAAMAISKIARLEGGNCTEEIFHNHAMQIKDLFLERLWDDSEEFFKVIPLESVQVQEIEWRFRAMDSAHNVKEETGFIPWYFNLPDSGYEAAWKQLMDTEGFYAPFGPTTAEQRHPRFMFEYPHECLWNGPSWPFATSQTLTALANLLNNYNQKAISKKEYMQLIANYARSHYRLGKDGKRKSWIDENLNPFTGEWASRKLLEQLNWPEKKGGRERGKDYNHSTYCDLVITGLCGLRPRQDKIIEINPLISEGVWDYFCLDNIKYHGRDITIMYDKYGNHYHRGAGMMVYENGVEIGRTAKLDRILIKMS